MQFYTTWILSTTLLILLMAPLQTWSQSGSNPKTDDFLIRLKSARTIDDIVLAAKQTGITEIDRKHLEKALNRPDYLEKIRSLAPRKAPDSKMHPDPALVQSISQKLQAEERRVIKQLSQRARSLIPNKKEAAVPSSTDRARFVTKVTPRMQSSARRSQGTATSASIMSTTIPAIVGRQMVITGRGFGEAEGRVVVRIGREVVQCPVHRWRDAEIAITLAPELGERIGNREQEATLWVKLEGQEIGPSIAIRLTPAAIRITSLSAEELHPGQELRIDGASFLDSQGTIRLTARSGGSLDRYLTVLRWENNSILLELDENCSGILETTCTLAVRNVAGGEASASIVFKPAIEVRTIWEDEWYRIDCYHYGDSDLGRMASSFVSNFFGLRFEKTAFKGITLGNQWTVVSGYVDYHGGGAGHGAEVTRQPREGSSSPEFRFVYWADGWAWVHAFPYAIIQGPRGTQH